MTTKSNTRDRPQLTGSSIAGHKDPQSISFPNGAVYNKAYMDMIVRETQQSLIQRIRETQIPVIALTHNKPHEEVQIQAVPIEALNTIEKEIVG